MSVAAMAITTTTTLVITTTVARHFFSQVNILMCPLDEDELRPYKNKSSANGAIPMW